MFFYTKALTTNIKRPRFYGYNGFIWLILLVAVLSIIDTCTAIRCYKCTVTAEKYHSRDINSTITTPICSKFDYSDEFIMECPYSTMCLKTISRLHLQNGEPLETITRGCAQQKDTTQVFRNSQWQQEHSIQEVYQEGCKELKNNILAGTIVTHCYCRGNLCNSNQKLRTSNNLLFFGALLVILVLKMLLN